MTRRKKEDTGILKRKYKIVVYVELALEKYYRLTTKRIRCNKYL
jgi:hypothetical protein